MSLRGHARAAASDGEAVDGRSRQDDPLGCCREGPRQAGDAGLPDEALRTREQVRADQDAAVGLLNSPRPPRLRVKSLCRDCYLLTPKQRLSLGVEKHPQRVNAEGSSKWETEDVQHADDDRDDPRP